MGSRLDVRIIDTPDLGDRSYVVTDGDATIVIDPQRDLDRVDAELAHAGGPLTHVLETHIHNDYLTGGVELARREQAIYGVSAADDVRFERLPLRDGDELTAGRMRIRVIATPGHTDTHVSYLVAAGDDAALFSGGSLLFGTVGRTDLLGDERTEDLSRAQYRSARRLGELARPAALFPTHGFGSFCASGPAGAGDRGTVADELHRNPAFAEDEDGFVARLRASFGDYPAYYAHMAPINRAGPRPVDLASPVPELTAADVRARLAAGHAVVDLRDRGSFAAGHLAGVMSVGAGQQLATYVGWLLPFGAAVTLIADTPEQLADARRQLCRIGYDDIAGFAGPVADLGELSSFRVADFEAFAGERRDGDVVLDVRRDDERADAPVIRDATGVPIHALRAALGSLPRRRIWVHCASGFRAGIAAGMLHDAGHEVVHVDDDITRAAALGLTEPA